MFNYKTSESQNYIFHYLENSLAEKEIDLIIKEQEKVIAELKVFLMCIFRLKSIIFC